MKYTSNYNFALPQLSDYIDTAQYNNNFTMLDTKLKSVETLLGQVQTAANQNGNSITSMGNRLTEAETLLNQVKAKADQVDTHKHTAGDINSGMFAEARVPILSEAGRITGHVGPYSMEQNIGARQRVSFTLPFASARSTLPKRVRIWFRNDASSTGADLTHDAGRSGKTAVVDIFRSDSGALSIWTEASTGADQDGNADGFFRGLFPSVSGSTVLFSFNGNNNSQGEKWTGYGGGAFTDQVWAQDDSDPTPVVARFYVYFVSMTTQGITFQIYNDGHTANVMFAAYGCVFD